MHRSVVTLLPILLAAGISLPADQNMLNNGGFETGVMCYAEWIWSWTYQDFKGDYKFRLSSDAHSGANSLEIACEGSDCMRAAIYSNQIPVAPGRSYKLSLYAKCPQNMSAFMHVPNTLDPSGNSTQWLSCTGDWTFNTMTFQPNPTSPYFFFYIFNNDWYWLRVDDVVLTYSDGTIPQSTTLYPGVRNVGISGQTVTVDGSPFLSLGFFDVGYNDLPAVAATGANTINGLDTYNAAACFNYGQPSYLDRAYSLGLNFLPDSSTTARLQTPSIFPSVVQTFAPHLANIGWFLADEPDLIEVPMEYIPAATFVSEYNAAKPYTSLPILADIQRGAWGTAADITPYAPGVDLWMAEPYGCDFSSVNHAINLFNSVQPRPVWLAQDAIDATLLVPKAYWVVISGATGIQYFKWDNFKSDSAKLAAASQAFSELNMLKNAIFGRKLDSLVTAPSGIGSMSRYDPASGTVYILAANPIAQTVQGTFSLQNLAATQPVTVMFENRTITPTRAGYFADTFNGVSRHVYAIHAASTSLSGSITNTTGPDAARDWQIQVFNSGLAAANGAQVSRMAFTNTGGKACAPAVAPGVLPLALGNLAPGENATADVTINFTGCDNTSRFTVNVSLSANGGAASGTILRNNVRK